VCIHYDFQWKISQREKIRARRVYSDTDPDLVLAPSDFWKVNFQARLDNYLKDEDKFPGDSYTCEETIIEISIGRSCRRGLTKRCKKLEIDWQLVDEHLEGLSDLFSMGRKITFSMEFVYKGVTCDSTTAKGKKKKKSATEAQRLQRAADASLWTRVYERYRCRAKHCKQGPHCWPDERGIHQKLLPGQLEEIVGHIRENIKGRRRRTSMLASRSHLTYSKMYWITTASGRQMAPLTVVNIKPTPPPTTGVAIRPRYHLVKIWGAWKGIDRPRLRVLQLGPGTSRERQVETRTADCKSGCNRSVPRTEYYPAAPKGRRSADDKEQGSTRHCTAICEQHQKISAGGGKVLKREEDISRLSFIWVFFIYLEGCVIDIPA
jgi:hypothetical protein